MRRTATMVALVAVLSAGCKEPAPAEPIAPSPPVAPPSPSTDPTIEASATDLPGRSIYQLGSTFTDAHGRPFELASTRGHPTVVLLFYGTCEAACPVLIQDVLRIDAALRPEARARVRYTLVSFDPENDTPARLLALMREKHLDAGRFHLVTGRPSDILSLSVALGLQYTRRGDGDFSHSNVITLLDRDGVVDTTIEGLNRPVEPLVARAEALAGAAAHGTTTAAP